MSSANAIHHLSTKAVAMPDFTTFVWHFVCRDVDISFVGLTSYLMDIQYIGEFLFPGKLGHWAISFSFLAALAAAVIYAMPQFRPGAAGQSERFRQWGRWLFSMHFLLMLTAAGALYYLIFNHHFEYRYVWQYSSRDMAPEYILSCFWAGQEGSFFVWAFWQALLGVLVIWKGRDWEMPVMAIVGLSQAFLMSMLLGWDLGFMKLGGDPFILLREVPANLGADIFQNPNYLKQIIDGNGLNPLLENPWMVSHPPVLFLGYASVLIPFAYAISGLWTGRYHAWMTAVRPWALFSAMALATGILLGGAWAYVALTFGGFWAWDPVENASLVPWLTLMAGIHFLIASRKHNISLLSSFLFLGFAYVMVLYSSFLTRSGILSETSVHSFGDDGLANQLIIFVLTFLLITILPFLRRYKDINKREKENLLSREFWMFLGGMVLVLSAFQIIFTTSIPVVNAILGTNIAPPIDPVTYYNNWQLPYAVLIGLLIGFSQYMAFGPNPGRSFLNRVWPGLLVAVGLTVFFSMTFGISRPTYIVLIFGLSVALVSSFEVWQKKGFRLPRAGSALTHLGFALFLIGVVITFSNETVISKNTTAFDLGDAASNTENQLLLRGDTVPMGSYAVTYQDKWVEGTRTYFKIQFLEYNRKADAWLDAFTITPNINVNQRMGNVYEPATVTHLDKDVYAFISFAELGPAASGGYNLIRESESRVGDTVDFPGYQIIMDSLIVQDVNEDYSSARLSVKMLVSGPMGNQIELRPSYILDNGKAFNEVVSDPALDFGIRFERVSETAQHVWLGFYQKQMDYVVLKAIIFPFILIMWLGVAIMLFGMVLAMVRRMGPQ